MSPLKVRFKPVIWILGDTKAYDDFLEELNIHTYNNFTQYLFWDVLTGLTKLAIIRKHLEKKQEAEKTERNEELDNGITEEKPEDLTESLEKAVLLRLELEFEQFDKSKQQTQLVQQIKAKYKKVTKTERK